MDQGTAPRQRVHFSMLRDYQLADLLTLSNGAAGTAAILFLMSYLAMGEKWRIYVALSFFPLALIFDIADGKVARRRHKDSVFGRELDSLADILSFGLAPVALAFVSGMRGGVDAVILIYFVCCGISRLARFNITATELADAAGKVRYFEGTPIPSSLLLVIILAACFLLDRVGDRIPLGHVEIASLRWHPLSLIFVVSGSAMISKTLRIPKF